jgi:hypothetical protein
MPQSANFSVQNALKLTYKHPEIPKNFLGSLSLAIKGREHKGRGGDTKGVEGTSPQLTKFPSQTLEVSIKR